jgi:hypothetical protein
MSGRIAAFGLREARVNLDWISRTDGGEVNELALAAPHGIGLDRASIPGRWLGSGAGNLGLTGEANLNEARRLFIHGVGPQGQQVASQNVTRSCYSAVFDVDKSISLLLAHSDPRVRAALNQAMEHAMESAFLVLEQQARIRRGKGGIRSERPIGLTGLRFAHQASSAGDPHAHMHLMFLATAQGDDGKWITLDGRQIFAQGMRMATQEFQIELFRELARQLDLSQLKPSFTLVGSTYVLRLAELAPSCEALSSASRSMMKSWEAISGRKIITGLSHRQHHNAWSRHRQDKRVLIEKLEHELDEVISEDGERASSLRQLWRTKMGDGAKLLDKIGVRAEPLAALPVLKNLSNDVVVGEIKKLHTFNLADLTNLLRFSSLDCNAETALVRSAKHVLDNPEVYVLTDELRNTLKQWVKAMESNQASIATEIMVGIYGTSAKNKITTKYALDEERVIAKGARELSIMVRTPLLVTPPAGATFEQMKAIAQIAKGRGLTVISGVAGSGKTFILRPITEAAKRQGLSVLVLARNANLARDLGAELNVASKTLASFKHALNHDRVDLRSPLLIIVDEAGLIDRGDWEVLADLAKDHLVQIVAAGDRRQAQPIDKRATFATIMASAIEAGACQVLETTYRNKAWVKEATALRNGDADTVLACASEAHRVIGSGADELFDNVWNQYVACKEQGEDVVVLARDNENAATMASLIQERLGIVGTHEISKEELVGIGDEVRTRFNVRELGITNGDRFRVINIVDSGIVLSRLDNNQRVILSWDYASQYVELAYASTIDSVQGQTRDRVIVLVDSAIGNTSLYSGTTRGRQAPIYLVKTETNEPNEPNEVLVHAITNDDVVMTLQELYASYQVNQLSPAMDSAQTTTRAVGDTQKLNPRAEQTFEITRIALNRVSEPQARERENAHLMAKDNDQGATGSSDTGSIDSGSVIPDDSGRQSLDRATLARTDSQRTPHDDTGANDLGATNTPVGSDDPSSFGPVAALNTSTLSEFSPLVDMSSQAESQTTPVPTTSPHGARLLNAGETNEALAPSHEIKGHEIKGDDQDRVSHTLGTTHAISAHDPTRNTPPVPLNPSQPAPSADAGLDDVVSSEMRDESVAHKQSLVAGITNQEETNDGVLAQPQDHGYQDLAKLEENDESIPSLSPLVMSDKQQLVDGQEVSMFAQWLPIEDFSRLNQAVFAADSLDYGKRHYRRNQRVDLAIDPAIDGNKTGRLDSGAAMEATVRSRATEAPTRDPGRRDQEQEPGTRRSAAYDDIDRHRSPQEEGGRRVGQEPNGFSNDRDEQAGVGGGIPSPDRRGVEGGGGSSSRLPQTVTNLQSEGAILPDRDDEQSGELIDDELDASIDDEEQEFPSHRGGFGFGF